jgi:hypothetical protein
MPLAIGGEDGVLTLYPPQDTSWVSHSSIFNPDTAARAFQVPMRSVASIMAELGHQRLDVLKLDIEGSEYDVIDDVLKRAVPIGQLLVEFHHRFAGIGLRRTETAIGRLEKAGFMPFAVGRTGQEVSFIHSTLL